MKNFKTLLTTFCLILLFTNTIKAQDEDCPVCGWYLDGVMVTKVECYSFDKLQLVLPYNSGWSGFDKVNIIAEKGVFVGGVRSVDGAAVKTYVKGGYLVYTVFAKDFGNKTEMEITPNTYGKLTRTYFAFDGKPTFKKGGGPAPDNTIVGYAEGLTFKGYTEAFDQGCQCIKKTANYDYAKISKKYELIFTNRTVAISNSPVIDMSQPCIATGTKADMNNLGKSSGSSTNNNSVEKIRANIPASKNSGTSDGSATGKTIITASIVKTQAQLKPLDKTKLGYFEEKDGGKITRAGYKKGDEYLGEVREYNSDGTVSEVSVYTNGIQDGLILKFDGEGKLETSGYYKNGNSDGTWQWFSNGTLTKTTKYANGQEQ